MNEITHCSHCRGNGVRNSQICPECMGSGVYLHIGRYTFFWGASIDEVHILYRRVTRNFKNVIDSTLLIIGIAGIFLFFFSLITLDAPDFGSLLKVWEFSSWQMLAFWASIITDSFLFYRFMRRIESEATIPKDINIGGEKALRRIEVSKLFIAEALNVFDSAYEVAKKYQHGKVTSVHLFISLLAQKEISELFLRLGVPFSELQKKLSHLLVEYESPIIAKISFSQDFRYAQMYALEQGINFRKKKLDLSDVLIGTVKSSEPLSDILYDLEITAEKIHNVALWNHFNKNISRRLHHMRAMGSLRSKSGINRSMTAVATPFLDAFSDDLTLRARNGFLEPCIGREKEIDEIFEILSTETRKNVVLVGDPGVGKRTLLWGLAQRMVSEEVPRFLEDKRLVSISVAKLVSGAGASEAEERLLRLLSEVIRSQNIILCVYDIAHITGVSSGSSGSMDLAGVLAEMLSRKQFMLIGTSTRQDFTHHIENSILGEALEKVDVKEVRGNTAIQVLESKTGLMEYRHGVFFTYDSLVKAIEYTDKYMHERYLPEKAIDILEETASRISAQRGKNATIFPNDVAEVVSLKIEVPLAKITQSESEKLLHLEEKIHERMVDQEEAVKMAAAALRRARAEIRDQKRPIVNLLFLGPTGVGKTQLAKTLAEVYFGSENKMIRLDMSEYQEKSSIYRLIGYPAGPQGGATEGFLTEQVRHHPFALLLLDEIEKAHPDILNVFLQVMDDARITDSSGRIIDFTNIIIICTSNACTQTIQKRISEGLSPQKIKDQILESELLEYFRPEFINRFDGIVVFKPLSRDDIRAIAKILIGDIAKELEEKGIKFIFTNEAIDELSELGFDPLYGARPMRRVMQERVDDVIANYLLLKKVDRRDTILLDVGGKIDVIKSRKY